MPPPFSIYMYLHVHVYVHSIKVHEVMHTGHATAPIRWQSQIFVLYWTCSLLHAALPSCSETLTAREPVTHLRQMT